MWPPPRSTTTFFAQVYDQEIRELADLLIERYGERAASHARYQALKAAQSGEERKTEAWRWIADAIDQLWRSGPSSEFG
jgi:hypothetical protein